MKPGQIILCIFLMAGRTVIQAAGSEPGSPVVITEPGEDSESGEKAESEGDTETGENNASGVHAGTNVAAVPVAGRRPKVGLVLSGGGAKGIAHVGVLKVIEEAGLKIDYIGGTSMGSIVGGLYAIGYDADSLEKLVLTRDWNRLLSDEVSRRDLSIEEKPDHDRFFVSFAFRERSVKLPAGVITGQHIENQFSELCTHINDIRDFNRFPIPYLCIAADVETGTEKVFRKGYLPNCMRASMAIPTVFTPIRIDEHLYVDGGVINNFPVDRVREMGADIIIGVNVGYFPKTDYDEMNMLRMIEHTVFMTSQERTKANKEACDIYIEPKMNGYSASSFSSGDSLISRGEMAARPLLARLRSLADSLNNIEYLPYQPPSFSVEETVLLREIRIEGIHNVSGRLVRGKLNLDVLERVSPSQISEAMDQLYSTMFFEKVTYELEPLNDDLLGNGVRLIVRVKERSGGQLKVGINYSNTYKASIILNTTFRNLLMNGSKTSLNLALGENPYFLGRYEKNNGWKPGFVAEIGARDMDLNLYEEGQRYAVLDYSDLFGRIYSQSIINNSYSFGFGMEYERISLDQKVGVPVDAGSWNQYFNGLAFINLDTWDNLFYPRRGTRFNATYKFIKDPRSDPEWFIRAFYAQAIELGGRFALIPKVYFGSTSADSNLRVYQFHLGGMSRSTSKGLIPFAGLDFMERTGSNVLAGGIDLQYNYWRSNYLVLTADFANLARYPANLVKFDDSFAGYALTLGNLSIVGPIEITIMSPNFRKGLMLYINIGHFF